MRSSIKENKVYIIIAFFILIVIILAVILSNNLEKPAQIPSKILEQNGWTEDIFERDIKNELLSDYCSYTYKNNNLSYPAYVTVTSRKTLFMMSEDGLIDETNTLIKEQSKQGLIIDESTKITGKRVILNGEHETKYVIYNGTDNSSGYVENIKIIGETWNCGVSGSSIICIGVAQITDYLHDKPGIVLDHWKKIVKDKEGTFGIDKYMGNNGLLFNVECH